MCEVSSAASYKIPILIMHGLLLLVRLNIEQILHLRPLAFQSANTEDKIKNL